MNESVWQNAEVSQVFIATGKFDGDQRPRWRPASFEIIELNGTTYVQTAGTHALDSDWYLSDTGIDDLQKRNGYGFLRDPVYLEDGAIGAANDDTILALHYFMQ